MSFGGPKTTTTSNQTSNTNTSGTTANQGITGGATNQQGQSQTGTQSSNLSSTTPNLPGWYSSFLSSIPGQYNSISQGLNQLGGKPLYGAPQQAAFQQGLNSQTSQLGQQLTSQLASRGALNSGNAAQTATGLALGQQGQLANYNAQTPLLNAQFQQGVLGQQGNLVGQQQGFTSPISAFGQTTTGTQQGSSQTINDLLNQFLTQSQNTGQTSGQSSTDSSGTQTQQTQTNLLGSLFGSLLSLVGNSAITGGFGG